ncbi:hypothetical protein FB45DRAFT_899692 [Roridomyces roridus]|uniref:F-box domain-containing protein n=1 Tax=Roridomyces roridus TaxID=1738132 RepID=A0AAD7C759_9AGAR|nr:hypothetical protein FB45DRAFT_899692 [Roridomyces roridus]
MDDSEYSEAARAADRARIVVIDAEIHRLQEWIRVLQMEQQSCQQRLDAYKYRVLTLPNEITSEIFLHFIPPYPDCPPLRGLDSPTTLTHICREWRDIALATPMLWRGLSIDEADNRAGVVQTWLDRSGSCPLSITLERGHSRAGARNESFIAALLYCERWQHVQLKLGTEEVALIKGPLPLLETLSLVVVGRFNYRQPTTSFGDFPRLRAVMLNDADHGWLPISQVTSLAVKTVLPSRYISHLCAAVDLRYLSLIECSPPRVPHGQNHIQLPRLEILVLMRCPDVHRILDMLTLTALHTLRVCGKGLGEDLISSLSSFISRSGCKLQQVRRVLDGSQESFRAAFPSVPKIIFNAKHNDWISEESTGYRTAIL